MRYWLTLLGLCCVAFGAQQLIDVGSSPNVGGDTVRAAFTKVNANDTEIYNNRTVLVTTLAEMISSTVTNTIYVRGRTTPGDGFEGTFRYVAGGVATTNLGTIFDVTSGQRVRDYSGALNVTWFGALGNGTADDSVALTNAIATAAVSDTIVINKSIYIGTSVEIDKQITLEGFGNTITALTAFTNQVEMVSVTADNVAIQNLEFKAHSSVEGSNKLRGLLVSGIDGFVGENLKFTDLGWNALEITNSIHTRLSGIKIFNCQTYSTTDGAYDIGCLRFSSGSSVASVFGVSVSISFGRGITISASSKITASNLIFNELSGAAAIGLYGTSAVDCMISDINSTGVGVFKLSQNCERVIISGVRGTVSSGSSYGAFLQGASNCTIENVQIKQTLDQPLLRVELHPDPNGSSSTGNRFYNSRFEHDTSLSRSAGYVGTASSGAYTNGNTFFYGCQFYGKVGFTTDTSHGVEWHGSTITGIGGKALVLSASTNSVINGCVLYSDNSAGTIDATSSVTLNIDSSVITSVNATPLALVLTSASGVTVNASRLVGAITNLGNNRLTSTTSTSSTTTTLYHEGETISELRLRNETTGKASTDGSFVRQSGNELLLWNQENSAVRIAVNNTERITLLNASIKIIWNASANVFDFVGAGTPEGAVAAGIGSTFRRTDGGAATSFYVKESGTGTAGWVGK